MVDRVVRNTLVRVETPADLGHHLVKYVEEPDEEDKQLQGALGAKAANTATGFMQPRIVLLDAQGYEVPFPVTLIVEATFTNGDP